METNDLTFNEQALMQSLPAPPKLTTIHVSKIWIVEWLSPEDQRTGSLLHEWMNKLRPGWSEYTMCRTKQAVILAIDRAKGIAQESGVVPALHLEAHGSVHGLEGPDGTGGKELLSWNELTEPLQRLNLATRCNLIVFVAACAGFAGIQALVKAPRAPAIALVGPDADLGDKSLLAGSKEFYRRWSDTNLNLDEIAFSASQETRKASFEVEPFVVLAYESLVGYLIRSKRPSEHLLQIDRIRQSMRADKKWSSLEIELRLQLIPQLPSKDEWQRVWDEMFMIDIYPENQERFGVDMRKIVELVSRHQAYGV